MNCNMFLPVNQSRNEKHETNKWPRGREEDLQSQVIIVCDLFLYLLTRVTVSLRLHV